MIKEAKDLLEEIAKREVPAVTVVRSVAGESHAIMERKWPLVSLITNPGTFDNTEARVVRYTDGGTYKQRYVRGDRVLPILLRCWAASEEDADDAFSRILPAVPSQWVYDDFVKSIEIGAEEHSDHAGNVAKMYLSVAAITFRAAAAMKAENVPYFTQADPEGGEFAKQE
jgi:hypothetical protein